MTLQTRGSAILDKAQRRLAGLKSIDENLDLGHGLTITTYMQLIEVARAAFEAHNTLVSTIDESRRNLTAIERTLAEMTSRMLTGVATKYGKSSNEYRKVGGSTRRRNNLVTFLSLPEASQTPFSQTSPITSKNGNVAERSAN
jgi:hypothetical protein